MTKVPQILPKPNDIGSFFEHPRKIKSDKTEATAAFSFHTLEKQIHENKN